MTTKQINVNGATVEVGDEIIIHTDYNGFVKSIVTRIDLSETMLPIAYESEFSNHWARTNQVFKLIQGCSNNALFEGCNVLITKDVEDFEHDFPRGSVAVATHDGVGDWYVSNDKDDHVPLFSEEEKCMIPIEYDSAIEPTNLCKPKVKEPKLTEVADGIIASYIMDIKNLKKEESDLQSEIDVLQARREDVVMDMVTLHDELKAYIKLLIEEEENE